MFGEFFFPLQLDNNQFLEYISVIKLVGAQKIRFNLKKICIHLETCYLYGNSAGLEFAVVLSPAVLMASVQGLDNLWVLHI